LALVPQTKRKAQGHLKFLHKKGTALSILHGNLTEQTSSVYKERE
jgi:hypothetical protein